MAVCNIKYDRKSYSDLNNTLKLLYNQINRPGIEDRIIKTLEFKYKNKDGLDRKIVLTDSENLDETSRGFISDVDRIVCSLANTSLDMLPEKARKFRNIVLSTFFDMNNVGEVTTQVSETEKAMETDKEKEARKLQLIDDVLLEIFGPINTGLILEVTNSFSRELRLKLIYNNYSKIKYSLNANEVNLRIVNYKKSKFLNILNFLKKKYPSDSFLLSIKEMYSNGMLNSNLYYYVIDTFKNYILSISDRNNQLNRELEDNILQNNKIEQESLYKLLINIISNDLKLKNWFDNTYNTPELKAKAESLLFEAGRFSNYYLEIKDKLLTEVERGAKDDVLSLIKLIENPKNALLNYVNDYIILTLFDDLLSLKLGSDVGIERGFLKNVEPLRLNAQKYILKESHKHQKAGWETSNSEGSEAHTSVLVKDMLDTIYMYKYDTHESLGQTLDMSSLLQAWQSFVTDMLNGNIKFDINKKGDIVDLNEIVTSKLRELINTLDNNAIDNILNIFEILFKPNLGRRLIDFIKGENLLSELHKHILYSFYNGILDKDNPSSNMSIEINRINDPIKSDTKFLETVSDLCSLLYRNVNNNYIECDIRPNKSTFTVRRKFNWDSELFEYVERINYGSKVKLLNKLGEDALSKYNYYSAPETTGKWISTVELQGKGDKLYTFGFKYTQGANNVYGLFSTVNDIELENSVVEYNGKNVPLLDVLAEINLREFSNKLLSNKELLNEYETVLSNLLEMIDYYLNLNLLSDKGLEALLRYKDKYSYDVLNGLFSDNYLYHFLKLAIRAADIDNQARLAEDMKLYLQENSKYKELFTVESKKSTSDIFDILANKVYFKLVTTKDKALSDLAKSAIEVSGKGAKSTILNKEGANVSNYSIARLGSELNRRLYNLKQQKDSPALSLLFVLHMNAINIDPVIDSEITTIAGDVKAVRDMSSGELFQHAILDKFYTSYIKNKKVCFQPTVYSDKTLFLNYISDLSMFKDDDIMNLMLDKELTFIDLYKNTFFAAHNSIRNNIVIKLEKLVSFLNTPEGLSFKKAGDVFNDSRRSENVRTFLRNRTLDELLNLVYQYNLYNEDKIELEMDKDYRSRGKFCDLNEIVDFYSDLYSNYGKLIKYIKNQLRIFLNDLEEYGVTFKVFDSTGDLELWVNGKELSRPNYLIKILSDEKILKAIDRKKFADLWINKVTGELILEKGDKMNPFLLKFFYIEGIFSNNLRLSLSGSEINHPDKAKKTLFNQLKKLVQKALETGSDEDLIKLQNALNNNGIKYGSLDSFIERFSKVKAINDLNRTDMQAIYDKTIIEIINTAEGTQFKRNVIIPATLLHPIPGKINGPSNKINAAVVYDMKAPVNNLRESDEIDSLDGSAKMSFILVRLENNALGDQRVGTNRKPIWDDLTGDLTSFLAKFAAFGQTNALMLQSLLSNASEYNMFKKMHNIRWNSTIDLTNNINQVKGSYYIQEDVSNWFKNTILEGLKLFYKNQLGEIVQITDFGKDASGYYTIEKILGLGSNKVYHYFSDITSEHSTEGGEGFHTIDSLYELFVALGGINCTDAKGVMSEFSNLVLTNFVINVGYKKKGGTISSTDDIIQPLKDKFIAYVFNNSAVKNGAKNINNANAWTDDSPLNTFKLNMRGLGIQLNADHDVVDLELTEFSQVVAACAAYGKKYSSINEIYYSLAESAFEASRQELTNIENYFKNYAEDPSKAKYKLYRIVGKLIVLSKSNNDMDLTEKLKLEINKEFKINKDNSSSGLKIPFSDPSIYTLFITNITSVINAKSIKRKHPGSGYVMAPGYNVVLYFQWFDKKTKTYRKYLFNDVLKRARNDFRGKLINALETWCIANNIDPNRYGENKRRIVSFNISTLLSEVANNGIDVSTIPYINISTQDTTEYNKLLVNMFLAAKLNEEALRDKSWFMPTDIVDIIKSDGSVISHSLDDMTDYYKFKNGFFDIEDDYNVIITLNEDFNKYTISLKENPNLSFVIERDSDKWNIHFKTGGRNEAIQRRTPGELNEELKIRLFNAALQVLPDGAILRLSPTTKELIDTGIGGLTKGSVVGYLSIFNNQERHTGVELEQTSDSYNVSYFDINGNLLTTQVSEYRKIRNIPSDHTYRLNITKPNNLKPSLIRWQYIDPTDSLTKYMTIYDHPIIRSSWNLPKNQRPKLAEILKVLDLLDKGKFELNGLLIDIIPESLENTEAELVLGNMYKDVFQTGDATLADIMDLGEEFFKKLTEIPEIPKGFYNLAFVKNNGLHTLISFSRLVETLNIYEDPFDHTKEYINEDNEIYDHEDGIKIGKYIPSSWKYEDEKVLDQNNNEVDKSRYRLIQDDKGNVEKVLLRIDYVKRYKFTLPKIVNGEPLLANYTLYNIAPVEEIRKALDKKVEDKEVLNSDAYHLISSILNNIYSLDKYIDILVNTSIDLNPGLRRTISMSLVDLGNDTKYDKETNKRVPLTPEEIKSLPKFLQHILGIRNLLMEGGDFAEKYKNIKTEYYEYLLQYKKQYSSFLTSLHFISSRIPAQSLQSFMPMTCVGWTAGTGNTAYVSYILTYLLGSDY